jgi:hypothetical protein
MVFYLIEFSMTKLFNNSSMVSLKITKPPQYTFTLQKISNSRYFQWHQEHSKGCYGLGQTKQTTLLNIYMNHKGGPKRVPNISKKIVIGQSKWHLQQQPPKNNFLSTPLNKSYILIQ